ncbi:hypothetical protein PAXRUDRAFT_460312 [Paxillus rubicundulus Ve08.2h10]|uniref:Uncharacterized protein n=1 Tax=Paxillus rubicundulus Ve08.2h10 TaxID=930991 RepID=A0A0D0E7R1_9AGAM|nr:hypothetical protein PAXRUDRAFT_460312 [Paxillus rubicundulus Ve08.2h10]
MNTAEYVGASLSPSYDERHRTVLTRPRSVHELELRNDTCSHRDGEITPDAARGRALHLANLDCEVVSSPKVEGVSNDRSRGGHDQCKYIIPPHPHQAEYQRYGLRDLWFGCGSAKMHTDCALCLSSVIHHVPSYFPAKFRQTKGCDRPKC